MIAARIADLVDTFQKFGDLPAGYAARVCQNYVFTDMVKEHLPETLHQSTSFVLLSNHAKDVCFTVNFGDDNSVVVWILEPTGWQQYNKRSAANDPRVQQVASALEKIGFRNAFYAHLCEDLFFWDHSCNNPHMRNNILGFMQTVYNVEDSYLPLCYSLFRENKDVDMNSVMATLTAKD